MQFWSPDHNLKVRIVWRTEPCHVTLLLPFLLISLNLASLCSVFSSCRKPQKKFCFISYVLMCLIMTKVHSEFFQGMYYWSFKNIFSFSCEQLGFVWYVSSSSTCLMLRLFLGIIFYKLFQNKVHTYTELNILHRIYQIYFEKKKKYSMSSVRNKRWNYCISKKTYFRMEIFLRKIAEYTDLGKCLF